MLALFTENWLNQLKDENQLLFGLSALICAACSFARGYLTVRSTLSTAVEHAWCHMDSMIGVWNHMHAQEAVRHAAAPLGLVHAVMCLSRQLQTAGDALCRAVAHCDTSGCSNPSCTTLWTVSEGFALVRGEQCVCGGCMAAR